ncbi:phospholipase [Virgibacillus sp. L01]|uniref:phospholipase n=1 Tax=Virgibacillus sp. L01 TaxID=3457429 RepID=UPI003FD61011
MEKKHRNLRPRICLFPGYRWCGPRCSGPGSPINAVDAACKEHDMCYRRYGPSCKCDEEFLCRLRPLINPYTQQGRHARTLYYVMKIQTIFC